MTFSKSFQTIKVSFLFLHVNDQSIVEVLPIAGLEPILGMEKFSSPSDVILLNS